MRAMRAAVDAGEIPGHQDVGFYVEHVQWTRAKYGLAD